MPYVRKFNRRHRGSSHCIVAFAVLLIVFKLLTTFRYIHQHGNALFGDSDGDILKHNSTGRNSLTYNFRLTDPNRTFQNSRHQTRQRTCNGCFPHHHVILKDNDKICDTGPQKSEKIEVVLIIFSAPGRFLQRQAIRTTFLRHTENNTSSIRYVYLLGLSRNSSLNEQINKEHNVYRDIVQEDFIDDYKNLTLKTIMGLKWVSNNCMNAKHVMKIDDDVFLSIPRLLILLKNRNLKAAVAGMLQTSSKPCRDPNKKSYVSKLMYPKLAYPHYIAGPAYVMGTGMAKGIYTVSKNVPYFPVEDVYVAFCVKILGNKLIHIDNFTSNVSWQPIKRSNSVTSYHGVSVSLMNHMWTDNIHFV